MLENLKNFENLEEKKSKFSFVTQNKHRIFVCFLTNNETVSNSICNKGFKKNYRISNCTVHKHNRHFFWIFKKTLLHVGTF